MKLHSFIIKVMQITKNQLHDQYFKGALKLHGVPSLTTGVKTTPLKYSKNNVSFVIQIKQILLCKTIIQNCC